MEKKIITLLSLLLATALQMTASDDVTASVYNNRAARLQNGLVDVKIDKSGKIYYLGRNGKNLLGSDGSIYYSTKEDRVTELQATKVEIKTANPDYAEIIYTNDTARIWKQQGFILKKGESKIYTYIILKGTKLSNFLEEARLICRTAPEFLDGYVSDNKQGLMPSVEMMKAVKEDGFIQDATFRLPDGSIYTKYDWVEYTADNHLHGVMNTQGTVGIWSIQASSEYVSGGPMHQDLTVHMDDKTPTVCQYFHSAHFGACGKQPIEQEYEKIFGPVAIYVNEGTREEMIADAKNVAACETEGWPYQWFDNESYDRQRATVSGKISLENYPQDREKNLQVVLSDAGTDPYMQYKGYCFWSKTTDNGEFSISNVRPGKYSLYVYATDGEITETLEKKDISVDEATSIDLGTIEWAPAKYEQKIWQLGESDRTSKGFMLSDSQRAYANFMLPPADIDFRMGESNAATDWYYAQTKKGSWNILFNMDSKPTTQCYLTSSVAAAARDVKVTFKLNGRTVTTRTLDSNDGSIYRSAMLNGRHSLHVIKIPASIFKVGENKLTLQIDNIQQGGGVMWDCIKLETGKAVTSGISNATAEREQDDTYYSVSGVKCTAPRHGIYIRNGKKVIL